jgi:hypothetical protein
MDHRHEQVDEQQQGNHAHNDGFHSVLLQGFAEADVKAAHHKKCDYNAYENQVTHSSSLITELNE